MFTRTGTKKYPRTKADRGGGGDKNWRSPIVRQLITMNDCFVILHFSLQSKNCVILLTFLFFRSFYIAEPWRIITAAAACTQHSSPAHRNGNMPAPSTTLFALVFLLSTEHGTVATQHVRGAAAEKAEKAEEAIDLEEQPAAEGRKIEEGRDQDIISNSYNSSSGQRGGDDFKTNSSDNHNQQQQQEEQQGQNQHRGLHDDDYELKGEEEYASCPESYPSFGTLGELLKAWNPNQPEVPEGGVVERLRVSRVRVRLRVSTAAVGLLLLLYISTIQQQYYYSVCKRIKLRDSN